MERELEEKETATAHMDQEDKRSLEDIYVMQDQLREITNNLLQRLKDTSSDAEINLSGSLIGKNEYKWEDVKKALSWIEWKKGGEIRFRVKYLDNDKTIVFNHGSQEANSYGWGKWETNPFRFFFYSEGAYNKSMGRVIEKENALQKLIDGEYMLGVVKDNIVSSEAGVKSNFENKFRASVTEAILDFEMQVASKLIEWTIPESMQDTSLN